MTFQLWFQAFLLTLAIELPIWLFAARGLGPTRACLIAVGTSAITHPIVWFAFPWAIWPYLPTLLLAEAFAVIAEALLAKSLGLSRPWFWSLIANAASLGAGVLSRWAFGWP